MTVIIGDKFYAVHLDHKDNLRLSEHTVVKCGKIETTLKHSHECGESSGRVRTVDLADGKLMYQRTPLRARRELLKRWDADIQRKQRTLHELIEHRKQLADEIRADEERPL